MRLDQSADDHRMGIWTMKWQSERESEREKTLTVWLKNYKNVYRTPLSASDSMPTGHSRCILCTKIARAFSKPQSPVWLWTQFPGVWVHRVFTGPLGNKVAFTRYLVSCNDEHFIGRTRMDLEGFRQMKFKSIFVWGTYFEASKQDMLEGNCRFVYFDLFAYIHCGLGINYSALILIKSKGKNKKTDFAFQLQVVLRYV